jgi:hypothetical protein
VVRLRSGEFPTKASTLGTAYRRIIMSGFVGWGFGASRRMHLPSGLALCAAFQLMIGVGTRRLTRPSNGSYAGICAGFQN